MSPSLPRAEDFFSSANDSLSPEQEVRRYEEAMKAEIDPLFSDDANRKTEYVINAVSALYDDLIEGAKSRGSNSYALGEMNRFIFDGMIRLVHGFSEYFDDDVKELRAFVSLLDTRRSEAIWASVFRFYLNFDKLNKAPPSLASDFISRFWDCYQLHVDSSILKENLEKVFEYTYRGRRTEQIELFERYSTEIAKKSSPDKREKIEQYFRIREWEPPDWS